MTTARRLRPFRLGNKKGRPSTRAAFLNPTLCCPGRRVGAGAAHAYARAALSHPTPSNPMRVDFVGEFGLGDPGWCRQSGPCAGSLV